MYVCACHDDKDDVLATKRKRERERVHSTYLPTRDRYSWESVRGLALIDARRYAKLGGTRAEQTASIGSDFASVTGKQTPRLG